MQQNGCTSESETIWLYVYSFCVNYFIHMDSTESLFVDGNNQNTQHIFIDDKCQFYSRFIQIH